MSYCVSINQGGKKVRILLIPDKKDYKAKKETEEYYIMVKWSVHQEDNDSKCTCIK